MLRVLLAEDHKIVRQGTRLYLETKGIEVVAEAETGREAACSFFRLLDNRLSDRAYLAGEAFSMADILALCSVDFAAGAVGLTPEADQRHLARWHAEVSARPSADA